MSLRRLYPERPLIGVGAVVLRGTDVLLIRRARPPRLGQWSIPGGLVEHHESLEAACRREIFEETGVVLGELFYLTTVETVQRDSSGVVRSHYILVDFAAEAGLGAALVPRFTEVLDAAWVSTEAVDSLRMWPETLRVIAAARMKLMSD